MIFKKNNKIISWIFAIIFIAIVALFFVSYRESANAPSRGAVFNSVIDAEKQPDIAGEKKPILPPNKNSQENQPVSVSKNEPPQNQSQIVQEQDDNLIKVTLAAENNRYDISVEKGTTAYDAMAKLASSTSFSFSAKYYSGLGHFIDAINGIKNANGNYWTLYVNGKYATVGASAYVLSENDGIEWKYTDKPI